MIYTSYFANRRNYPEGFKKIRIALWPPKYQVELDGVALELAPTRRLLLSHQGGLITDEEYARDFNIGLKALDPIMIANKYDNCILLCYEKTGDFCHRNLVCAWLNQNGIQCEELSNKSNKKSSKKSIVGM